MPSADLDNVLYWNELDSSDSRYDRTRAGPSDQGLVVMWSIYSPLLFLFSGFVLIVFLGILTNPKVRKNPFNKYILFLSFPDFLYSFLCAITCLASALNGGYSSWEMCQFQVFYLNFGAAANSWLNGVMAYEIYVLLRSSRVRRRYFPPSDQKVYITSSLCYLIALIGAGISLLGSRVDWLSSPGIQAGFVCTVNEDTWQHTLTFWLLTAPLLFALPYAFASYVFYDVIIGSKLLPPRGKRRELSIYFFRYVILNEVHYSKMPHLLACVGTYLARLTQLVTLAQNWCHVSVPVDAHDSHHVHLPGNVVALGHVGIGALFPYARGRECLVDLDERRRARCRLRLLSSIGVLASPQRCVRSFRVVVLLEVQTVE